jgi:hypothetical protein
MEAAATEPIQTPTPTPSPPPSPPLPPPTTIEVKTTEAVFAPIAKVVDKAAETTGAPAPPVTEATKPSKGVDESGTESGSEYEAEVPDDDGSDEDFVEPKAELPDDVGTSEEEEEEEDDADRRYPKRKKRSASTSWVLTEPRNAKHGSKKRKAREITAESVEKLVNKVKKLEDKLKAVTGEEDGEKKTKKSKKESSDKQKKTK